MSIVAATGLKTWLQSRPWSSAANMILIILVAWQIAESAKAQGNLIAYSMNWLVKILARP